MPPRQGHTVAYAVKNGFGSPDFRRLYETVRSPPHFADLRQSKGTEACHKDDDTYALMVIPHLKRWALSALSENSMRGVYR